jgi:hypothetical protein
MFLTIVMALFQGASGNPCKDRGVTLYVNAARRRAWLCEGDASQGEMRVALGQGGLDKHLQGDGKVPLGEYLLGPSRPSRYFHLFLPVGYPTMPQRRDGYTGGAIGVHGPPRGFEGPGSTDTDWTLGCIAVGTDAEIDRIAAWVRAKGVHRIVIEAR